ncbi:hypothetical protein PGB90_002897 [Kerria lacca]
MGLDYIFRLVRKKIVLITIFGFSLCYCIYNFSKNSHNDNFLVRGSYTSTSSLKHESFIWNSAELLENITTPSKCRNSIQGKYFIVDDRGFVCKRTNKLSNGCCNLSSSLINRYSCNSCNSNGCCNIYEYCVSCCLDPNKRAVLENIFSSSNSNLRIILSSLADQFELCIMKCRTNSFSVYHENTYRDTKNKFCYKDLS